MQRNPYMSSEGRDGKEAKNSRDSEPSETIYDSDEDSIPGDVETRELTFSDMQNEWARKRQIREEIVNAENLKRMRINTNGESLTSSQMGRDEQGSRRAEFAQMLQGKTNGQPYTFPTGQPVASAAYQTGGSATRASLPSLNDGINRSVESLSKLSNAAKLNDPNLPKPKGRPSKKAYNTQSASQTGQNVATNPLKISTMGPQAVRPHWMPSVAQPPHTMHAKVGSDWRPMNSSGQNGQPPQTARNGQPSQHGTGAQVAPEPPNVQPPHNRPGPTQGASTHQSSANQPQWPFSPYEGGPPGIVVMGNGINIHIDSFTVNMGQGPSKNE